MKFVALTEIITTQVRLGVREPVIVNSDFIARIEGTGSNGSIVFFSGENAYRVFEETPEEIRRLIQTRE